MPSSPMIQALIAVIDQGYVVTSPTSRLWRDADGADIRTSSPGCPYGLYTYDVAFQPSTFRTAEEAVHEFLQRESEEFEALCGAS